MSYLLLLLRKISGKYGNFKCRCTKETGDTAANYSYKSIAKTVRQDKVRYSPAVLRLAQEYEIALDKITGTGEGDV